MIGICTDSNSQLPPELAERYGIEVVPLTVRVDGREHLEGFDLDVDDFYALYVDGRRPTVEFDEPSPGQFALAYDDLVGRGCTQILSVHTTSATSATLRAARLAAHSAPVPVRLVDSRTARFGVSCCVWAAADAIAAGADLDHAATVAETLAPSIGNVFIATGLAACRQPYRTVYSLVDDVLQTVCRVDSVADAANAMAAFVLRFRTDLEDVSAETSHNGRLHVAVGSAHRDTLPVAQAIAHAVGESARVIDVVHFRLGPSVGVESGPGTVGCVMFPG